MYGHFYDNNRGNQDWYHRCPHIQFHKVQDNPHFQQGDSHTLHALMEKQSDDVKRVYKMYTEHFSDTFFDPLSGNYLDTGESMFEHVKNSSVKAVIFDWDRTLQQFECMSTNSFESWCQKFGAKTDKRKEDFALALAIYHAGGTQRFNALKDMFAAIKQQKKIVYIITGNPAVRTIGKELYIRILNKWGLDYFNLVYAMDKYYFMANDPILCGHITQ